MDWLALHQFARGRRWLYSLPPCRRLYRALRDQVWEIEKLRKRDCVSR